MAHETLVTLEELNRRALCLVAERERRRLARVNALDLPLYVNRPVPPVNDSDLERLAMQDAA